MNKMLAWADRRLILIQKLIISGLLAAILLLALIQILFRYFLYISGAWTEELARLGLVWAIFLSASLGVRLKSHTILDFFLLRVPVKMRHVMTIITAMMIMGMGIVMIIYGLKYAMMTSGDTTTSLGFERNLFYIPVPFTGVLITLYAIGDMAAEINGFLKFKKGA